MKHMENWYEKRCIAQFPTEEVQDITLYLSLKDYNDMKQTSEDIHTLFHLSS